MHLEAPTLREDEGTPRGAIFEIEIESSATPGTCLLPEEPGTETGLTALSAIEGRLHLLEAGRDLPSANTAMIPGILHQEKSTVIDLGENL